MESLIRNTKVKYLIVVTLKLLLLNSAASHSIALAHDHTTYSTHNTNKHNTNKHNAHQHGYAELTMIIEGNSLMVQILSPADSLLGFEHQAATEQELATLNRIKNNLASTNNILTLDNGDCRLIDTLIDTQAVDPKTQSHKATKPYNNRSSRAENHAEIEINYQFTCASISKVNNISLELFKHYPAIEQVRAIWIRENKQGSYLLTPSKTILTLN
ncbi:DUF2796 domain-containing protein [Colwellia sp. D2M02]|uniref:ZrgA family zinc uptake protein n=1 Tax=Colwellia sp. D2M02 TaxID=2841562 RepID=UPI001C0A2F51|nr:DUF2796 domain-containing protein [Colwellia sp. D2M02]MBU2893196.1 DUF2796 domain-containing protein [Colwellia sp. D2M02]